MRTRLLARAALVPLLLAAGCARTAGGADAGAPAISDDAVALRVEYVGGFVPPASLVTRLPVIAIYGDGRVITEGPQVAVFPGPALPNIQVRHISDDDVRELMDWAVRAGVGNRKDLGTPAVADAPSTRITVWTPTAERSTEAVALQEGVNDPQLTTAQREARGKLVELVEALADLPATLGTGAVDEARPYEASRIAGVASLWQAPSDPGTPKAPELAWPGPKLPGESPNNVSDVGCVVAEGEAAKAVIASAAKATSVTPWTSDGRRWTVALRPLLPDETRCADLGD